MTAGPTSRTVQSEVPSALAGERVDRVVALLTGLPRSDVTALVEGGGVRLRGRTVASRSTKVVEGDVLEVDVPELADAVVLQADAGVTVPVVHVDDDVIVVDKPAGVVVHPGAGRGTGTLVHGLLALYPELAGVGEPARPGIVHRLDKGTSGLMVVARTAAAYEQLVQQMSGREVERQYRALVWGSVEASAGMIDAPVGRAQSDKTRMAVSNRGREARTRYEVDRRYTRPEPATLLRCRLETGRTHQIRVHLAAIGHPVVGDPQYGTGPARSQESRRRGGVDARRPFLHAERLVFRHPATGASMSFSSVLPPDLEDLLARFA